MTTAEAEMSRVERAHLATQALTEGEFKAFRTWVALDEAQRREREAAASAGQVDLVRQMRDAGMMTAPTADTPWTVPDGLRIVWLEGDQVTHGSRVWQSADPGLNQDEPGTSDTWWDITPPEQEPDTTETTETETQP